MLGIVGQASVAQQTCLVNTLGGTTAPDERVLRLACRTVFALARFDAQKDNELPAGKPDFVEDFPKAAILLTWTNDDAL